MANVRLGGVFFDFTVNTAQFQKAMANTASRTRRLDRAMAPVLRRIKQLGVVATGAAVGLAYLGKTTADSIDRQAKLAQSLRTSIGSIQILERAAELSGLQVRQLEAGFRVLTVQLSRLADGSAPIELQDVFQKLGLSIEYINSLPLDKKIDILTKEIKRLIPAGEQAAAMAQLFGTRTFLAFTRIDTETLRIATHDMERFGGVLSDLQGDRVEAMNDSLSRLSTAMTVIRTRIVADLAPAVLELSEKLAVALEAGSDLRVRLASISESILSSLPKVVAYGKAFIGAVVGVNALIIALGLATRGAIAFRAALLRTGSLAAVVGVGELIYRFTDAAEATDTWAESVETITEAIKGHGRALKDVNSLSELRVHGMENEARAALALTQANIALRKATFEESPEYRAALKEQREATAALAAAPEGRWTTLMGVPGQQEDAHYRKLDADLAVHRLRSDHQLSIRKLEADVDRIGGMLVGAPAPLTPSKEGGAEEYTDSEKELRRVSLMRKLEDAELSLRTEMERRLKANERARDAALEEVEIQGEGYEHLAARVNAAYDEIERRIRGQTTLMEKLATTADDVGASFGNFAESVILDFRGMSDAAKALGRDIARSLARRAVADPLAGAISAGIGNIFTPGAGMTVGPQTLIPSRSDGGPFRGYVRVGERGPEVVHFGQPGTVLPNQRLRGMGGGAPGVGLNLNVRAGWDREAVRREVQAELAIAGPMIVDQAYAAIQRDMDRPSPIQGGR